MGFVVLGNTGQSRERPDCFPMQAALPFKSKPKVQAPRTRKTLEQKRAIPLEPAERKAVSLYAQLNAIRNEKAEKRRTQQSRRRVVRTRHIKVAS